MIKLISIRIGLFLISSILFYSCTKESFITNADASLYITADTVKFDTVFTTTGSITQSFKIINENNQKLLLSSIKLMGGNASAFRININGVAGVETNNIEIAANDSIYVFVAVTIQPTSAQLPFIVSDSILIAYNGNNHFVQLEAFGQNAHFLRDQVITGNKLWPNDLPYVLLGSFRIDTSAKLTIEAGCKIYIHALAPVLVDGTLEINGEKNNEVIFSGDRLDEYYRNLPGSWAGIYFRNASKDNRLTFTVINNATRALVVQNPSLNASPKLILHQCILNNASANGLLAENSSVEADNSLISNCGNNIQIQLGGDYSFSNCTVAAYSNAFQLHNTPVLQATNFLLENANTLINDLNASFTNCIFWGEGGINDDEVAVTKEGNSLFNVSLENCMYKSVNDPSNTSLIACIKNQAPQFDSIDVSGNYYDFRITKDPTAPGIDQGVLTSFPKDLDDQPRNAGGFTDIGSYEKQ